MEHARNDLGDADPEPEALGVSPKSALDQRSGHAVELARGHIVTGDPAGKVRPQLDPAPAESTSGAIGGGVVCNSVGMGEGVSIEEEEVFTGGTPDGFVDDSRLAIAAIHVPAVV